MRHTFRLLSSLIAMLVSVAVVAGVPAFADEPLKGAGAGLQLLEQLMWTKDGADSITDTMAIVEWEPKYCLPPDEPNKDKERAWLKLREAALATYIARFNALKPQFLNLIANDATALKAVMGKTGGANPTDDTFFQTWQTAFNKARAAIKAKRAELEPIEEEDCTPPPPPPPQPVDWTAGLTPPTFGPPDFPPLPDHHCSWDDYWALIRSIHPYFNKSVEDAQVAARYRDRVGARLVRARDAGAPADQVAQLEAMFKAASAVAAERQALSDKADKHYRAAKKIPVIDCRPPEQPQPPPADIPGPSYEMFVYPGVPDRFCTEAEKQSVLKQLQAAKEAARRNYEKAKAHVAALEKRIASGDRTPGLGQALADARAAATNNFNKEIELDGMYYKALAMPVVDCGKQVSDARGTGLMDNWEGALGLAVQFGGVHMGSGGFLGFEVSPTDRGVGTVRPNPSADVRGLTGEINVALKDTFVQDVADQIFDPGTTKVFIRPRISMYEADASASGTFVTPGSTLLPGLGGPTEAGFILGDFPGVSNDVDWRYTTEQRAYDFDVALRYAGEFSGFRLATDVGLGHYSATRSERIDFEVPDFGASGSYSVKSDVDAPYVVLGADLTYPFGGGSGWTPYVKGQVEGRVYFYDAEALVRHELNIVPDQFRNVGDSGTAFGWTGGLELGVDIDQAAVQLYVGYRHMENELSPVANIEGGTAGRTTLGVTTNDLDDVVAGARVRF